MAIKNINTKPVPSENKCKTEYADDMEHDNNKTMKAVCASSIALWPLVTATKNKSISLSGVCNNINIGSGNKLIKRRITRENNIDFQLWKAWAAVNTLLARCLLYSIYCFSYINRRHDIVSLLGYQSEQQENISLFTPRAAVTATTATTTAATAEINFRPAK